MLIPLLLQLSSHSLPCPNPNASGISWGPTCARSCAKSWRYHQRGNTFILCPQGSHSLRGEPSLPRVKPVPHTDESKIEKSEDAQRKECFFCLRAWASPKQKATFKMDLERWVSSPWMRRGQAGRTRGMLCQWPLCFTCSPAEPSPVRWGIRLAGNQMRNLNSLPTLHSHLQFTPVIGKGKN